jgi:FAD:protein FMN transferase
MNYDDPPRTSPPGMEYEDLPQTHRFAHKAMATIFEILCIHEDRSYAEQATLAAFALLDRLESELTCHQGGGDISRINRLKPGETAAIGPWAMECLLMARHFYFLTGGAFDISLGSGFDAVELFPADLCVRMKAQGVHLDLGGIGKGYAIDRAAESLEEWDVHHALLHGGYSSVLALEAPPGREGWPLTISLPAPESPSVLARMMARRQCWSASGIRKKDHIVDPHTGVPVRNRTAVWVSGSLQALAVLFPRGQDADIPTGMFETGPSPSAVAEALSTAFMIMPFDRIADLCLAHPGIEGRILTAASSGAPLLATFTR